MLVGEHFMQEQLVFADESHFNRLTLRRNYAWAPWGDRARRWDFFVRGKRHALSFLIDNSMLTMPRYSILPAISLDGVIHLKVIDHAFTGHEFANFIWGVLDQMQPWPLPNSVLIMDNVYTQGSRYMGDGWRAVDFSFSWPNIGRWVVFSFQQNAATISSSLLARPQPYWGDVLVCQILAAIESHLCPRRNRR